MKNILGVLSILVLLCSEASAADDWLKDEVLKQLSELRQDNKALRGQVEALGQRLAALESPQKKEAGRTYKLADLLGGKTPLGKTTAPVVVAEFTDYECPFCRKFDAMTFPELKKRYLDTGKARYVVRDFPLPFHGEAKPAAAAARCAGEQNAFWPMKHALFAQQQRLGRELFLKQAAQLKLDGQRFRACLDDPRTAAGIDRDIAYGDQAGVQATPTFLVGRAEGGAVKDVKAVSGAMGIEEFARVIDALAKPK